MKRIYLIAIVVLLQACSLKSLTVNTVGKIAMDGQTAITSDEDVEMARQAIYPLIKELEVFLSAKPKNKALRAALAKAYGQLAFGFIEEDILNGKEGALTRAILFYGRGKNYGLGALGIDKIPTLDKFNKKVSGFGKKDLNAMFWCALSWAGLIDHQRDDPLVFGELPYAQALLDRVMALDSKFEYGAALALKGSILASRPKALGGDPEGARNAFEQSLETESRYLMNRVVFAERYAKVLGDKALFTKLLEETLEQDPNLPEQRLANTLAKRRAKILLQKSM